MLLPAIIGLGALGLFFGLGLGLASRKFAVKIDPKVENILEVLPGANCGACGMAGCCGFAEAVAAGKVEPGGCAPGGAEVATNLGNIMGIETKIKKKKIARLQCRGGKAAVEKFIYQGANNCRAAALLFGGHKICSYGCLGLGTCMGVCPFGAISLSRERLPIIAESLCTGCGKCVAACPRGVMSLILEKAPVHIFCKSQEKGRQVRAACKVGCIGCGICAKICPKEAIAMENNLAQIDYNCCDGCGKCVEKCPTKCIVRITTQVGSQKHQAHYSSC